MRTEKKIQFSLILAMFGAMAALLLLVLLRLPETPIMERITFRDTVTGQRLVPSFDSAQDQYVLYLPGHMEEEQLQVRLPGGWVKTQWQADSLKLTAWSAFEKHTETLEVQHCTGVQSLFLEAEAGTREYLHEDKTHEKEALVILRDEAGALVFSQVAKVSGRGNSSWDGQAKRPYELRFDGPVSFGPFEEIGKLCLLAEYSDESKLRNSVAYFGAQAMGLDYASGYTYANVYFGGEYLGLYGIATKEEYTKYIQTDGIQAVFEVTSNADKQDFRPSLGRNPVRVIDGDVDAAAAAVEAFEAALIYEDWESCEKIIDTESFARKYVMEEFFANSDMTYASQYFYLDEAGIIHCMLPWDYDLSLGYAFRYYNNKQVYEVEAYKDENGWYAMLVSFPQFRQQVLNVLEELCSGDLISRLQTHLTQTAEKIAASWECDRLRWRNEPAFNRFDLTCGAATLEEMAALYADFFPQRGAYLTTHFETWEDQCRIEFDGDQYGNLCLPKGANLWDYLADAAILQGEKINSDFVGWVTEDGMTPEDVTEITGNMKFYDSLKG